MRQIYSRPSRRPPVFHPHTLVILSAAKKPRISSLLLLLQLPVLLPINGAVISTEATHAAQWRNPLVHLGFHQPLPCSCTAMYCSRTCRCLAVALAVVLQSHFAVVLQSHLSLQSHLPLSLLLHLPLSLSLHLPLSLSLQLAVVLCCCNLPLSLSLRLPLFLLLHLPLCLCRCTCRCLWD
jgi:hypothetical protein